MPVKVTVQAAKRMKIAQSGGLGRPWRMDGMRLLVLSRTFCYLSIILSACIEPGNLTHFMLSVGGLSPMVLFSHR